MLTKFVFFVGVSLVPQSGLFTGYLSACSSSECHESAAIVGFFPVRPVSFIFWESGSQNALPNVLPHAQAIRIDVSGTDNGDSGGSIGDATGDEVMDHGNVHVGGHVDPQVPPPGPDASAAEIEAYVAAVKASPDMSHMIHSSSSSIASEHMAAMGLVPRDDATHVAIRDGDWNDPDTWFNGAIPGDDARVLVPEGITVNYGLVSDARLFTLRVDGTLDFATDADSQMVFDTMIVSHSGSLIIGTVDDPVGENVDVNLIVANNGPIDTDWDPMLLSRGIIAHGATSIHGAEKDSHEKVIEDPMAGDTSVRFESVPEGWQVGDTIIVAGTRYDGYKWDGAIDGNRFYPPEDEERIITEILDDGTVLFDEPLIHNHDTPRDDLATSVANYTRNVSIETENADTAEVYERGHVMFMHSDQVDVRYAEFMELGRTDKSDTSVDISDVSNPQYDTNVQGRYSLHLHRTGVDDIENPALVIGNAVYGSPGWGFVHHDSNAVLSNNASYDTFGAGYVAETGNETGAWHDNIAIFAQGTSWAGIKSTTDISSTEFDTARGGDGFWFQGRLVTSTDNIAASVNTGFAYFHRDGDNRMIDIDSDLFEFPGALYFDEEVSPADMPIRNFDGNETFGARYGLQVIKANPNQGHDVWSHLTDFTAWSVQHGAHFEYTSHYILEDFDLIGKETTRFSPPEEGIEFGNNITEMVIINPTIADFDTGIDLKKNFVTMSADDHDYFIINPTFINVDTEYAEYDPSEDTILDWDDIGSVAPDLDIDGPLLFNGDSNGVDIEGTKTDTLGTTEFPGGTDGFDIRRSDMVEILETTGYWTTENGDDYTLLDLYFTDRVTGDIYYETFPVFIDSGVPLGERLYADAINNGTMEIMTTGETQMVGDLKPINLNEVENFGLTIWK